MSRAIIGVLVSALMMGGAAAAHHSYSAYHTDRLLEFEGNVEALEWSTPHSFLKVRSGDTRYMFEWAAPMGLQRQGIDRNTLKPGDRVILTGNPHRDIAENGVVHLKSVRRPSDGWNWPSRQW